MNQMLSDMGNMDHIIAMSTAKNRRDKIKEAVAPISKEFRDAICHAGTPVQKCLCGITYFVSNGDNMEKGELKKLLKQEVDCPSRFIGIVDQDSISWGLIEGQEYVWHCEFCQRVKKIEQWVINHRHVICEFLKSRAAKIKSNSERESGMVSDLD